MGRTPKPLNWLVSPEYMEVMRDLETQGHVVHPLTDLVVSTYQVILAPQAWYCPNVEFLTKYRDIIIKQARMRKYGKDIKE